MTVVPGMPSGSAGQSEALPLIASSSDWSVRLVGSGDCHFEDALHLTLVGRARRQNAPRHRAVAELLGDVAGGPLRIDPVCAAFQRGVLRTAALAVASPGGSALVMHPQGTHPQDTAGGIVLALRRLVDAARERSYELLEALVPLEARGSVEMLARAGFRQLTDLIYLSRAADADGAAIRPRRLRGDLSWQTYAPATAPLFHEAVRASYVQSLDCPELTTLRTPDKALAAHRAIGLHDPLLWFVVMRGGDPVGVLLLSPMRNRAALEIVYMGVTQVARGTGVADAMMERALECALRSGRTSLALAVDARNGPARSFYGRWHFTEIGRRSAWIATPLLFEG